MTIATISITTLYKNNNAMTVHNFNKLKSKYYHANRNSLSSYEKGISAEYCAKKLLISKGYEILGCRIRNMYGELDLVVKKGSNIAAVEVKQRKTLSVSRECLTYRQKQRISNAFALFISERKEIFETYRIDVVCFDINGNFEHIENAFYIEEVA